MGWLLKASAIVVCFGGILGFPVGSHGFFGGGFSGIVNDPIHTAINEVSWAQQAADMIQQLNNQIQQIENQIEQIEKAAVQIQHMEQNLLTNPLTRLQTLEYTISHMVGKLMYYGNALSYRQNGASEDVREQYDTLFPGKEYGYPVHIERLASYEDGRDHQLNWNSMMSDTARHAMYTQAEQEQFSGTKETLHDTLATLDASEGNLQAVRAHGQLTGQVAMQMQVVRQLLAVNGRLKAAEIAREAAEERLSIAEHLRVACPESSELRAMVDMPGCTNGITSSTGTIGNLP